METRKNIFFAIAGLVTAGMLATITSGVALASDQDLSPTVTQISGTAEDTG